ncbi:hypothetical protein VNO80_34894 [Phaseolus coccineus]|uniref:Uncharacterized protein n=1 Tax=Phaseolus coccineus TaxID=3886 RepID=A0AAN9KTT6_PHACN
MRKDHSDDIQLLPTWDDWIYAALDCNHELKQARIAKENEIARQKSTIGYGSAFLRYRALWTESFSFYHVFRYWYASHYRNTLNEDLDIESSLGDFVDEFQQDYDHRNHAG